MQIINPYLIVYTIFNSFAIRNKTDKNSGYNNHKAIMIVKSTDTKEKHNGT